MILDWFRRFKPAYLLYNLFQWKRLKHNASMYRKYGIHKKYFSSISSVDFQHITSMQFSRVAQRALKDCEIFKNADQRSRDSLITFDQQGYAILYHYFSEATIDRINAEVQQLMETGALRFRYGNKLMFGIRKSAFLKSIGKDPQLLELLSSLLQGPATLFQSINFLSGSEQHTHSDSIHMTTYPEGGLLGVWIALEDITLENGPLHYYPGSHQLPYYLNSDFDNIGNAFFTGPHDYSDYEKMIEQKIQSMPLKKEVFLAKKGDVLIWHANLLHGGEPHQNKLLSRKSMVLHYFNQDCICYHEITQRPALMDPVD